MKPILLSIFVDDQAKALEFYTAVLGFEKRADVPLGRHRWLTVGALEQPGGVEILLEPDEHPAVGPFKRALFEDGIPCTAFGVEDCRAEYERLSALGVHFTQPPTEMGPVVIAVLEDTCGNLLQLQQLR